VLAPLLTVLDDLGPTTADDDYLVHPRGGRRPRRRLHR
jgi:hypothetical protein